MPLPLRRVRIPALVTFGRPFSSRRLLLALVALIATSIAGWSIVTNLTLVATLHQPAGHHLDQADLLMLVQNGRFGEAFEMAVAAGDKLFETDFNALDGGGANVGAGQRYTRIPRADLAGPTEWAHHSPSRATGPNASACIGCHNKPVQDGAGGVEADVHRDPLHSGNLATMIHRNTPHMFGLGGLQRLAEEMTADLQGLRDGAVQQVCSSGSPVTVVLQTKGVAFGSLVVTPNGSQPCVPQMDTSGVQGVDADLVVRPFQWKGSVASLRDFVRGACHNEIGMQPVELVGVGVDADFDGVADEMTVGDQTALTIYLASQPRPTSKTELDHLGLLDPPLTAAEKSSIRRGAGTFRDIGCTACHVTALRVDDPNFHEPSLSPSFRDTLFPSGMDPVAFGVRPDFPVGFDITRDQPDNRMRDSSGNVTYRLGAFRADPQGRAVVELLGDLKRHDMGPGLAEAIDETGSGSSVFMTENLWGVGSTAPYLHDGRATTVTEAILEHGGEGAVSNTAFQGLPTSMQVDIVSYLESLVLFKLPAD